MSDIGDLIDTDDLDPGEEARLARVHDLLLRAGPPADLPVTLSRPPGEKAGAEVLPFPSLLRRRVAVGAALAATLAAAAFGGGYLFGHAKARPAAFSAERIVPMHGTGPVRGAAEIGLVKVAPADSVGNWPLEVQVSGLPSQPSGAYYELWLTRDGRPSLPCGTFRVHGETTTVRFTVPYALGRYAGWVVTSVGAGSAEPGHVVMTT